MQHHINTNILCKSQISLFAVPPNRSTRVQSSVASVHFRLNTLEKDMNPFILPAKFYFSIKYPEKVDMLLNNK